jgi:RNA 3'-terminal phosphate cyclase (ATP)
MLMIDGAQGEGGGQILRTALSLSIVTGTPFAVKNIRANRRKPGLLRQHLACVKAAASISRAKVAGAEINSRALTFEPGAVRGGDYEFAIGTAGSTALVFQTVLPALLRAKDPSDVVFRGGTHNPYAPTFDFLERAFLPLLARMGPTVELRLHAFGFYPAGGGFWQARVEPAARLSPLVLEEAGGILSRRIAADVANIPYDVAQREVREAARLLSWPQDAGSARTVKSDGPGNVLAIELGYEHVTEVFTGFGERGISAESIAGRTVREVREYLTAGVPVGPHLCDQLLLPMALAGGGSILTMHPTQHTRTNIAVVEEFLDLRFFLTDLGNHRWRIAVQA